MHNGAHSKPVVQLLEARYCLVSEQNPYPVMSCQASPTEGNDKIEAFRQLLNVITNNTKLEYEGKKGKTGVESQLIKQNLAIILGRNPTAQELARAKQYA